MEVDKLIRYCNMDQYVDTELLNKQLETLNLDQEVSKMIEISLSNQVINSLYESTKHLDVFQRFFSHLKKDPSLAEMVSNIFIIQDLYIERLRKNPQDPIQFCSDSLIFERKNRIDRSWFVIAKIYTLVLSRKLYYYLKYKYCIFFQILNKIMIYLVFQLNIFEAVLYDLQRGYFDSAKTGILLMLTMPFVSYGKDLRDSKVKRSWIEIYLSWNALFVGILGESAVPIVFTKLIASQMELEQHGIKTFGWHRLNTITLFVCQNLLYYQNENVGHTDGNPVWVNSDSKELLSIWGKHNLKWIKKNISTIGGGFISRVISYIF